MSSRNIHEITGVYFFRDYLDLLHLKNGEKGKIASTNKFLKNFKDFTALEIFATNTNDIEILGKISLVKKYGGSLLNYIPKILTR